MKKVLVNCWNTFFDFYIYVRNLIMLTWDKIYRKTTTHPNIVSIEETIRYIIEHNCSVSRLGDGEIKIAKGKSLGFQEYQNELQQKIITVLSHPIKNHIVCLPDIFNDLSYYKPEVQKHWNLHLAYYRQEWYRHIDKKRIFHNAFISRCYMMFKDQSKTPQYFHLLKQLWNNKDILLVEGEKSRLGIGNDLFDNVKSIKRILAPNCNAFAHYDSILKEVAKYDSDVYCVLLALGPTATVMAYDLSLKGYQAIDIGHIDIEYEWFKRGATAKTPIPNKFVNEAGGGNGVGEIENDTYKNQIVCRF